MDELREQLINLFTKTNKQYTQKELEKLFNITKKNQKAFYQLLYTLELEGKIILLNNIYMRLPNNFYLIKGVIQQSNRGNYFIKYKKENIFIDKKNLNGAKVGDTVYLELINTPEKNNAKKGKVQRIITCPTSSLTNENFLAKAIINKNSKNNNYWVNINNTIIYFKKNDLNGAFPGDLVNVLIYYENNKPHAKVINIIKRKTAEHIFFYHKNKWIPLSTEPFPVTLVDKKTYQEKDKILAYVPTTTTNGVFELKKIKDIKIEQENIREKIKLLALEKNLSFEFSDKIKEEVKALPTEIPKEEIKKRVDLRNLETFTIDSKTAKDLDDAISLEKIGTNYRLYVHIADVSYYIKPDMELFNEALKRGTSIYISDMVIPQFPKEISNGICSLNPHEDKLTKTLIIDIDETGKVLDFSLVNAIINSNYKMNYDDVDNVITNKEIKEDYKPFTKTLLQMQELSLLLSEMRKKRGALVFTKQELEFNVDEFGNPIEIKERVFGPAHTLIENFMLLTNQILADYAYWLDIPYVYRNHENPTLIDLAKLNKNLQQSRFSSILKKMKSLDSIKSFQKFYNNLLNKSNESEKKLLSEIFINSLSRAYYLDKNKGHFGLVLDRYATFTSPIRRGADLLNHLFLSEVLEKGVETDLLESFKKRLEKVCINLSEKQTEADYFEKEIDCLLLEQYTEPYKDMELTAKIQFFMEDRISIKTDNNLTGFIILNNDYYFDKCNNVLINKTTNTTYRIGDTLKVKIKDFDHKKEIIIFSICHKKEKSPKVKIAKKKKQCYN